MAWRECLDRFVSSRWKKPGQNYPVIGRIQWKGKDSDAEENECLMKSGKLQALHSCPWTWWRKKKGQVQLDTACIHYKTASPAQADLQGLYQRASTFSLGSNQWKVLGRSQRNAEERLRTLYSSLLPVESPLAGYLPHHAVATTALKVAPFTLAQMGFQELLSFLPTAVLFLAPVTPYSPGLPTSWN